MHSHSFFYLPFPTITYQNYKHQLYRKPLQCWIKFCKPKIRNFGNEVLIEKNVMRLDIKMQNLHVTSSMQIFNPTSHSKRNLKYFLNTSGDSFFSRKNVFFKRTIRYEFIYKGTLLPLNTEANELLHIPRLVRVVKPWFQQIQVTLLQE